MKSVKIWELIQIIEGCKPNNEVHNELLKHLRDNIDYYFEHVYENEESNKLLYLENNILIYFVFKNEHYETFYFPVNKIESISKSIGGILQIQFLNYSIKSNPVFYKSSMFKLSLDLLFEQILNKINK